MTLRVAVLVEGEASDAASALSQTANGLDQVAVKGRGASATLQATAAASRQAMTNSRQLSFQLIDIAQTIPLAFQSPLYALQNVGFQVAQISQLYIGNGGLGAAIRDVGGMLTGFVAKVWPAAAAGAALWGAYQLVSFHLRDTRNEVSATTRALAEQAAPIDSIRGKIDQLQRITDDYARAIRGTAKDQEIATTSILANSEKEFNAKKSLLELELKRQRAAIETQRAELTQLSEKLRQEVSSNILRAGDDVAMGYSDPKIGQFVRAPYQDALLERTRELIESSGLNDKVKELGANISLAEVATSALEEALKTTFSDSVATSAGRIASTAKTEAEKAAEKYRDLVLTAQQRIAVARLEAQTLGLTREAAERMRIEQELLNKAAQDNIRLTPQQVAELSGLATAIAAAEEQARMLSEAYNFAKGTFGSFFADLKSNLREGMGLWDSLGAAAANALDKIADRAIEMAANGIFDMIFGALFGGLTGGLGGSPLGRPGSFSIAGIPLYADGTPSHPGGWAITGERGPELVRLPAGSQVFSNDRSQQMLGGGVTFQLIDQRSNGGSIEREDVMGPGGRRIIRAIIRDELPGAYNDARRRAAI